MSNVLEVILNLIDNMTPGLETATNATDLLETSVENASNAIDNIDPGQLDNVQEAAAEAGLDMQQVGEAAAMAGGDISSIDPSPVKETGQSAEEAAGSADEMASGFGAVESIVSTLVGIGVAAWLDEIVNAAGNFQDSWSRIDVAMDGTINGIDATQSQWNGAINQMRDNTGRGAGAIRNFIIDMGIAGVESQDAIIGSFGAVSGAAFVTGKSIDTISGSFTNIVKNGMLTKRNIASLGLSTQDVMNATGKSIEEVSAEFKTMTPEARAAFLEAIYGAKYGTSANEAYKTSWARVKDQLGLAFDYLNRIVGGLILPLLIPALEFVTGLLNSVAGAINNMNPILKNIIGFILLIGGALTSAYLILSPIISALGSIVGPILGNFITMVMAAGGGVEGLTAVLGGLLGSIGPIGWAILAVIGIIITAITIWTLWSDEIIKFKNALTGGDWGTAASMIVNAFNYVGQAIYNAFVYAGQQIWTFITNLPAMIGQNATSWINMGQNFITWLIYGLQSLSDYLTGILFDMLTEMSTSGGAGEAGQTAGQETGKGLIEGFSQWVLDNTQLIYDTLNLLFNTLMPLIGQLILQLAMIIGIWMIQTGQKAATDFVNAFIQYLMQLPGRLLATLTLAVLTIFSWAGQLVVLAWQTGSSFVNNFILFLSQLPGRAWSIFLQFLAYLGSLPGRAYSYAVSTANSIVSGMGAYLQSLPGRMYTWGMQALGRFVDGIINSIPGLRAALDMVSSLFPHSPPKEGPLATIKPENMEKWISDVMEAGNKGVSKFNMNGIIPTGNGSVSGGSGSGELRVTLIHDFTNVPSGISKEELLAALRGLSKDLGWIDTLVKTLTKAKVITKSNLGA